MRFPFYLFVAFALVQCWNADECVAQKRPSVVAQADVHVQACGPCAIVNSMRYASGSFARKVARLDQQPNETLARTLIATLGSRKSSTYENKPSFNPESGVSCGDLTRMYQDFITDSLSKGPSEFELSGTYLDRDENETCPEHLRRVHEIFHDSLEQGFPPVLSIRTFATKKDPTQGKFLWHGLAGHFVTVTKVQPEIRENEKGFSFEFADPDTAKREFGYFHFNESRNFTAAKGNREKWTWIKDRPFLLITAPSVKMQTHYAAHHERTIITANYVIAPKSLFELPKNHLR